MIASNNLRTPAPTNTPHPLVAIGSRALLASFAALTLTTLTVACGDDEPTVRPDAVFAQASADQANFAIAVGAHGGVLEAVYAFASVADPRSSCPQIERVGTTTTLIGDGCVRGQATYLGRAVAENPYTLEHLRDGMLPDGASRYDFLDFQVRTDENTVGFSGTMELIHEPEDDLRSNLTVTMNGETATVTDYRFDCATEPCTQTGTIDVESLGRFRVDGRVDGRFGDLRLEGADVLTVSLRVETCVPYQVDGTEAGTYCPEIVLDDESEQGLSAVALPGVLFSRSR